MLTLIYFAKVREDLGVAQEQLEKPAGVTTVAELIDWLMRSRGEPWAEVLAQPQLKIALDQQMVKPSALLNDGAEVAFFPPVTGG